MQGASHVGFAIAGAAVMNTGIYFFFPHPLPGTVDQIVHAIGNPVNYPELVRFWQAPEFDWTSVGSLVNKLTFFYILSKCASLPDKLEGRRRDKSTGEYKQRFSHRGFTHSCLFLFVLLTSIIVLCIVASNQLLTHHLVLNDFMVREIFAFFLGIGWAIILHIIADMLTVKGVKVFWPDNTSVKVGLFANEHPGEYAFLWLFIFFVGALFAIGIVGF